MRFGLSPNLKYCIITSTSRITYFRSFHFGLPFNSHYCFDERFSYSYCNCYLAIVWRCALVASLTSGRWGGRLGRVGGLYVYSAASAPVSHDQCSAILTPLHFDTFTSLVITFSLPHYSFIRYSGNLVPSNRTAT